MNPSTPINNPLNRIINLIIYPIKSLTKPTYNLKLKVTIKHDYHLVAFCSEGARLRPTFKQAKLALKEAKPTHCPEGAPKGREQTSSEQGKALRRKVK